jgi:hypothetical protein
MPVVGHSEFVVEPVANLDFGDHSRVLEKSQSAVHCGNVHVLVSLSGSPKHLVNAHVLVTLRHY